MVVIFFLASFEFATAACAGGGGAVAIAGLFKLSTLKELWRGDRSEFVVAMAALLGVLTSGLLRGVLIGAIISLVQLLRAASRPHVALLGTNSRHAPFFGSRTQPRQRINPGRPDFSAGVWPPLFQHRSCVPRQCWAAFTPKKLRPD